MYQEKKADASTLSAQAAELVAKHTAGRETNLKRIRRYRGISQRQLAQSAGVALRMVQLYEQRQNDINKAQAKTVADLARALGCRTEDVLEH